jgi:hypothetical protein
MVLHWTCRQFQGIIECQSTSVIILESKRQVVKVHHGVLSTQEDSQTHSRFDPSTVRLEIRDDGNRFDLLYMCRLADVGLDGIAGQQRH